MWRWPTAACIARPPQPIPADLQGTAYTNDTMLMVTAELQDPHNIVVTIVWHRWPSLGLQEVKGKDCKVITAHLLYGHQLPHHQGATPSQPLITDELQGTAYTINSVEVIVAELQDTLCTVGVTIVWYCLTFTYRKWRVNNTKLRGHHCQLSWATTAWRW